MTPEQRAARIRLVVLDVDGVLTDGRLYYGPQGEVDQGLRRARRPRHQDAAAAGHRGRDPVGAQLADRGATRPRTRHRARRCRAGATSQPVSANCSPKRDVAADEAAFVGDDLPDLPVLQQVGLRRDRRRCPRRSQGRRALGRAAARRPRGRPRDRRVHPAREGRRLRRNVVQDDRAEIAASRSAVGPAPGRPKGGALIRAQRVHVRRAASRTPAAKPYA